MPNYRRNRVLGETFFLTVNLLDRRSDLLVTGVGRLRAAVRHVRALDPFTLMPGWSFLTTPSFPPPQAGEGWEGDAIGSTRSETLATSPCISIIFT